MIKDNLSNSKTYEKLNKGFDKAFKFLRELKNPQTGKTVIDGDNVYANINIGAALKDYNNAKWENHKKYIDIQYVLKGKEKFGYCDVSKLEKAEGYVEAKDIEFYNGKGDYDILTLSEGEFIILFPQDAHLPQLKTEDAAADDRVIVKVKIS
jgi:YhcH/YjgK/YiaL family protein